MRLSPFLKLRIAARKSLPFESKEVSQRSRSLRLAETALFFAICRKRLIARHDVGKGRINAVGGKLIWFTDALIENGTQPRLIRIVENLKNQ